MVDTYRRPDRTVDRFDADPTRSFTLPAHYYFDPVVLEQEKEAIFWKSWICIGHASGVRETGQYTTADVLGQRVFAIRSADGELRAFFNVCMHRGHVLLEGNGTAKNLITCPYHAWAYGTDGRLKGARMSDRMEEFDFDDFTLPEIAIEDFCGFLFVNLSANPEPMSEVYPGAEDAIRGLCPDPGASAAYSSFAFEIAANWKNVGDNLLECYHCHPAHPAFVDLIDMDTYVNETHQNWSIQSGKSREGNSTYEVTSGPQSFASIFLWPNVSIGHLPGIDGVLLFQFDPMGPEQTMQRTTMYGIPEGPGEAAHKAAEYFQSVLGPEDVALCESVQVGLRSHAYHQGRFICIPDRPEISEHAVHHFHTMVLDALD